MYVDLVEQKSTRWRSRGAQVFVAALVLVFTVAPSAGPAVACSCSAQSVTFAEVLADSRTVAFVGRAPSELNPISDSQANYTFNVEEAVRGNPGPTVVVNTPTNSCGVRFPLDVSIAVVVYRTDDGRIATDSCDQWKVGIDTLHTWASGTLPAPTGSGRIAGFGQLGPQTYGVVDEQMRVLGYVPVPRETYLDACPGGRFLAGDGTIGVDSTSGDPIDVVLSVDLTNLTTTRLAVPDIKWVSDSSCLDSDGRILFQHPSSTGDLGQVVEIITRSGNRQTVPPPAGATSFEGPTLTRDGLVWLTPTEVVTTDLSGKQIKRIAAPDPGFDGYRGSGGGLLVIRSYRADGELIVIDLTTGVSSTLSNQSEWRFLDYRPVRLLNPTTLEVLDPANGQRSQLPISNGPAEDGWALGRGYLLQLVKKDADNFYVIDTTGAATSYLKIGPEGSRFPWTSNTVLTFDDQDDAWLETSAGAQRVLDRFNPGYFERIDGPVLAPNACGTTAIPTLNYICDPPILPPTL